MKKRTLVSIWILALTVVAIFIFSSCDVTDATDVTPTMTGTWIISDYSEDWDNTTGGEDPWGGGGGGVPEIIIITGTQGGSNEYTCKNYWKQDDPDPIATFILTVTNQWTDSEGNLFIEYTYEWDDFLHIYFYALVKIHADNQTLEANLSLVTYPNELDPMNWYVLFQRQ
jgi:hypothetical protein